MPRLVHARTRRKFIRRRRRERHARLVCALKGGANSDRLRCSRTLAMASAGRAALGEKVGIELT
jgi:hypothetical protein